MKTIIVCSITLLVLSSCGGSKPVPPAAPAAGQVPAPAATAQPAAAPAPQVPSWTELHELHEMMEKNGKDMKAIKTALQQKDTAAARAAAAEVVAGLAGVQVRAAGFAGETPEKFKVFADDAVTAARALESHLGSNPDLNGKATTEAVEKVRAACKACHDVYKTED